MSNLNLIRVSNNLCHFSSDGTLVASCYNNKLTVRNTVTFEQFHTYTCIDVIKYFEWSPDNRYILCALYQHSTVQVFSLRNHDWKCKIRDAAYGIVKVCWSPDSRHILTTAEFHISICIWSLVLHSVKYIDCLKEISSQSLAFTSDGTSLAVVGDQGSVDTIFIYSTTSWLLKKQIPCVGPDKIGGITWTRDNTAVCVWGTSLDKCWVRVYEVASGDLIGDCLPPSEERICGIKTVTWAPSGQFLTLACFDEKIRMLNHITWQPIAELAHSDVLLETDCTVYQETNARSQTDKISFQIISGRPVVISSVREGLHNPSSLMGIGLSVFSRCGHYLATRADRMPAAVWIWNMNILRISSLIVHKKPVTAIEWDPIEPRLAIVCGSNSLTLWSKEGVTTHMFDQICISDIRWHPTGEYLVLCANTKVMFMSRNLL
ncbi:WD repeat-containing protein WRAP73-like [Periplaneta americana]|uniref:WD repeat-containing protein WRAP73-like n=1 Tax=Periplaneta americana TaxID=6978 RepID=UPI0037E719BD